MTWERNISRSPLTHRAGWTAGPVPPAGAGARGQPSQAAGRKPFVFTAREPTVLSSPLFFGLTVLSLLLRKNPPLENCNCPKTREHRPSSPRFLTDPLFQATRGHWGRVQAPALGKRGAPSAGGGEPETPGRDGGSEKQAWATGTDRGGKDGGRPGVEKRRRGEPATQQRGQRGPGGAPGGCGYPPHRPDRNGQGSLYCLNHLAFVSRPHPTQDCALHKTRGSAGAHPATGGLCALPQCPRRAGPPAERGSHHPGHCPDGAQAMPGTRPKTQRSHEEERNLLCLRHAQLPKKNF